ncbi:MAG TPA: hypothetical protein VKY19_24040 [Ktedonosporobacter sp.]|jgi:hypothetical protein|nr:hypothetical protein [Ktedonosporobacter sp.]
MIPSRTLLRFCGGATIVGATLLALSSTVSFLFLQQGQALYRQPLYTPAQMLQFYGAVALLMGISGLAVLQAGATKAAMLGLIGCLMTVLGLATLEIGTSAINAFIFPRLANTPTALSLVSSPAGASLYWYLAGLVLQTFGPLMFGIAIVRARTFPRMAGVLLIVTPLLGVVSFIDDPVVAAVTGIAFAVLCYGAFAWCGTRLLTRGDDAAMQRTAQGRLAEFDSKELVISKKR